MEFTRSFETAVGGAVRERYELLEVRNASAILGATNPERMAQVETVLNGFSVVTTDLLTRGGQETALAARLNGGFRSLGWREGRVDVEVSLNLRKMPYRPAGETEPDTISTKVPSEGYKVDNFADRIALDVEWNAKDGNLDRDIAAYRSLYDTALIDGAILVTRTLEIREFAQRLGRNFGSEAGMTEAEAKTLLSTTTTTNLKKLADRLGRGDSGGCPILVIAICERTWDHFQVESREEALPKIVADLAYQRSKKAQKPSADVGVEADFDDEEADTQV
jgi:hypothetical protein